MNNNLAILAPKNITEAMDLAGLMSKATVMLPKHFHGKPADCLAIVLQAARWGMDPYIVAGKTHVVSGSLGYEAQLVSAVLSSSNAISSHIKYEYGGEWKNANDTTAWVRVGAVLNGETDITWGEPLFPATVTTRNSPLWKTAPKQQSSYLALKYWARLYCPAAIMGVYTPDELDQIPERDITPDAVAALSQPAIDLPPKSDIAPGPDKTAEYLNTADDADEFLQEIAMAKTMDKMRAVANALKSCEFESEEDHERLRQAWTARAKFIGKQESTDQA
jgi:hypothetical protein